MLLTFLLAAALWSCNCWWNAANIYTFAVQPGYLDFDNLPDTNFSCDGKVIGGYYADVETGCQMFHVCTIGQKAEITDIKFLCLNGTVFDQETRVCERLDEVDCSKSESFFDLNLELYGNNGAGYGIAPEEPLEQEPVQCNADEEDCSGTPDYFDEEVTTMAGPVVLASTAATTSSTTTSTTARTTTAPTTTTTTSTTAASTRKPLPAISMASTAKPTPPAVSYPTNSPETIAALIALHNAFQDSLKEREQGPGPKGQHMHRYQSPRPPQQQQQLQPSPKPFTVANFQPPRHFPSKAPQPPPPPYRHQQQHQQPQHPVLLSSERFGNQNFRHGFRLQNGPPAPRPPEDSPPSYQQLQEHQQQQQQQQQHQQQQHQQQQEQEQEQEQEQQQQQQYNLDGGAQYDGSYDDDGGGIAAVSDDVDVDDEESRRNFAREAPEASVSVSVQVSSSSSKNSAIDQQQQRPVTAASSSTAAAPTTPTTTTTTTTTPATATTATEESVTAAARPFTAKPDASPTPRPEQPQGPPPVDDADSGDLYEDEYEELEGDEEFFKDVPRLGRNRRRRYAVVGRGWRA